MESTTPVTDRDFVADFRQAVDEYFHAVDEWEKSYRKYYRLPDPHGKNPSDMAVEQAAYDRARERFGAMVPRAKGLSFRHGLRDPWTGLLRSPLGQSTPQDRYSSAISRSERTSAIECLLVLAESYAEIPKAEAPAEAVQDSRSLWQRIRGFFY